MNMLRSKKIFFLFYQLALFVFFTYIFLLISNNYLYNSSILKITSSFLISVVFFMLLIIYNNVIDDLNILKNFKFFMYLYPSFIFILTIVDATNILNSKIEFIDTINSINFFFITIFLIIDFLFENNKNKLWQGKLKRILKNLSNFYIIGCLMGVFVLSLFLTHFIFKISFFSKNFLKIITIFSCFTIMEISLKYLKLKFLKSFSDTLGPHKVFKVLRVICYIIFITFASYIFFRDYFDKLDKLINFLFKIIFVFIAIPIVFKDIIGDIFSGIIMFFDSPFIKEDKIKINEFEGIVKEINLRTTVLQRKNKSIFSIPNKIVTKNVVINLSPKTDISFVFDLFDVSQKESINNLIDFIIENSEIKKEKFSIDLLNIEKYSYKCFMKLISRPYEKSKIKKSITISIENAIIKYKDHFTINDIKIN